MYNWKVNQIELNWIKTETKKKNLVEFVHFEEVSHRSTFCLSFCMAKLQLGKNDVASMDKNLVNLFVLFLHSTCSFWSIYVESKTRASIACISFFRMYRILRHVVYRYGTVYSGVKANYTVYFHCNSTHWLSEYL